MGKRVSSDEMQNIFKILQKSYDVYGPKIYQGTGCFSDTDVVRYGLLNSWEEIVWNQKSDYSFKEVLLPISETILYFTENEMKTADGAARQRLIFLKSCDFHALKRLDDMYLKNGAEDYYYRRMRENTVFAVMGCKESGKNCFCVSMGTNRCEEYDMYIFQDENGKTNLSLTDVGGEVLIISQFTLYANCRKGNRPSFFDAGEPQMAEELYEYIIKKTKETISVVESGEFGAMMQVSLVNEGPFTIVFDENTFR